MASSKGHHCLLVFKGPFRFLLIFEELRSVELFPRNLPQLLFTTFSLPFSSIAHDPQALLRSQEPRNLQLAALLSEAFLESTDPAFPCQHTKLTVKTHKTIPSKIIQITAGMFPLEDPPNMTLKDYK